MRPHHSPVLFPRLLDGLLVAGLLVALPMACAVNEAANTETDAAKEDAAGAADIVDAAGSADQAGPPDAGFVDSGADTGDATRSDTEAGDLGPDSADAGPTACCATNQDCAANQFCAPTSVDNEASGQCLLRTPPKGQCWKDSDCGEPGAVCGGVVFKGCGEGESELGLCDVVVPAGCCDVDYQCPGNLSCWQDYCLDPSVFNGCLYDSDCSQVGWVCVGAVEADGSCLKGGAAPIFGACQPSGPGGQCVVAAAADLGECDTPLGWGWQGDTCVALSGCGCGDVCDGLFTTQEECEVACSPPQCCADDDACGAGRQCVSGHCLVAVPDGRCFDDATCGDGLICAGARSCTCGDKWCADDIIIDPFLEVPVQCDEPPCDPPPVVLGTCIDAPVCCDPEGGCAGDAQCVPHPWDTPRCLPVPDGGACWTKSDCGSDEWCVGASSCGCTQLDCVPTVGSCESIPSGCCTETSQCDDGSLCTAQSDGPQTVGLEVGECVPPPDTGCYTNAQCPEDAECLWFSGWACGDPLTWGPPSPGECVLKDGMCCTLDADCPAGFGCARSPDGGVCKPTPEVAGECWDSSDCEVSQVCTEAKPCGHCSACGGASALGYCVEAEGLCCSGDQDCEPGEWCTATIALEEWTPPGAGYGQCVKAFGPGQCLNTSHCGLDQICSGFSGYPCGYPAPGVSAGKGDLWPGDCVAADGACCSSDLGCTDGYRCVGPTPQKVGTGACKPMKFDGSCWTDLDCSDNEHCEGGFVCGCSWCGSAVDTLGVCVSN